jgi:SAM-dependent methyltransferase
MSNKVSHQRWRFAQKNELEYQQNKAAQLKARASSIRSRAQSNSESVANYLKELGVFGEHDTTVEVGSGASGLIWNWPGTQRIAIDPLAHFFSGSFGHIQPDGTTIIEACGEHLPLCDGCAQVVLSDNVLDHVESPSTYLTECRRILNQDGIFYITVDVHHPLYWWSGRIYNLLFAAGLKLMVPAFPHHPFHFTQSRILKLIETCGFKPLAPIRASAAAPGSRAGSLPKRVMNRIQQTFYKNTRMEMILTR